MMTFDVIKRDDNAMSVIVSEIYFSLKQRKLLNVLCFVGFRDGIMISTFERENTNNKRNPHIYYNFASWDINDYSKIKNYILSLEFENGIKQNLESEFVKVETKGEK